MSSTMRTKHINGGYYCVKSKIDAGKVTIQQYKEEMMIGNFFRKHLSSKKIQRKIVNHKSPKTYDVDDKYETKNNKKSTKEEL